jgi:predicted unusual protein kinase regulating ubiquinone biosynthesis (AarF/ABC1/UbiB family)
VYQARLRPNSEPVAVKVQRPRVRTAMPLDLYILRQLSRFVGSLLKRNTDLPVQGPEVSLTFDVLCDQSLFIAW